MASVLINLMRNAIDAVQGAAQRKLCVRARADGSRVILTVTDTGPGIRADILPRLFQPFVSSKPAGAGLGLGLVISGAARARCRWHAPGRQLRRRRRTIHDRSPDGGVDMSESRRERSASDPRAADRRRPRRARQQRPGAEPRRFRGRGFRQRRDALAPRISFGAPVIVVCDVRLPGLSGVDWLPEIRDHRCRVAGGAGHRPWPHRDGGAGHAPRRLRLHREAVHLGTAGGGGSPRRRTAAADAAGAQLARRAGELARHPGAC